MPYVHLENAMRSAVWSELPAYAAANASTEVLRWALERAGFPGHDGDEDDASPAYWRAKALL